MAFFTSAYKLLAHLAPNWDTQLRTDMQALEDGLNENAAWTPGFGGTGAAIGSGATVSGFVTRKGQHVTYFGQIVFGSSASWGSGTPAVTGLNIYSNILSAQMEGFARFYRSATGALIPMMLAPIGSPNGSSFAPLIVGNGTTTSPTSISAPVSGESLTFRVSGVLS